MSADGENRMRMREHRLVVLPEFQGLGIGSRLSDATGARFLRKGRRYSSRTAHITLRNQRQSSKLWSVSSISEASPEGLAYGMIHEKRKALPTQPRGSHIRPSKASGHPAGNTKSRILYTFEYLGSAEEQLASFIAAGVPPDEAPLKVARAARVAEEAEATSLAALKLKSAKLVTSEEAAPQTNFEVCSSEPLDSLNGKRPAADSTPLEGASPAKRGSGRKVLPVVKDITSFF
ncbi:MAG: hypothetical protein SGPRY_007086 [Prymnesium sp.]